MFKGYDGSPIGGESMTKKVILALAAAAFCFGASACNTVKGLGEDVQSVGQAGSDAIH
jgi:predicted small secreted protein